MAWAFTAMAAMATMTAAPTTAASRAAAPTPVASSSSGTASLHEVDGQRGPPLSVPPPTLLESIAHMGRAVAGHLGVMTASRPVEAWLADPATAPAVKARLELAQTVRDFAVRELGLPDNPSYRRYADIGRSAVLWNVVAAPELSLDLHTWCYPVVGCVGYRGYFNESHAQEQARALQALGLEVQVYPVTAYSTLGWTNWMGGDPLLNTFAMGSPIELARLVFHELAHQVAFAEGDMAFSESYATAVERLGLARWQRHESARAVDPAHWAAWQQRQVRRQTLASLVAEHRRALQALYRSRMADEARRARKVELRRAFEARYRQLRDAEWGGDPAFDGWVQSLNNAGLALQGSYADEVPAFMALFLREGCRFDRFHRAVAALAVQDRAARQAELTALKSGPGPADPTSQALACEPAPVQPPS